MLLDLDPWVVAVVALLAVVVTVQTLRIPVNRRRAALSLVGLGLAGSLDVRELLLALLLVPCLLAGFGVSRVLSRRVDHDNIRVGVLGVCGVSALALLVRSLGVG